jgi:hypothetical protein
MIERILSHSHALSLSLSLSLTLTDICLMLFVWLATRPPHALKNKPNIAMTERERE